MGSDDSPNHVPTYAGEDPSEATWRALTISGKQVVQFHQGVADALEISCDSDEGPLLLAEAAVGRYAGCTAGQDYTVALWQCEVLSNGLEIYKSQHPCELHRPHY